MQYDSETYDQLIKPSWAPPPWAFTMAGSVIYTAYIFFGFVSWVEAESEAIGLYISNLVVILLWLAIFRKRQPSILGLLPLIVILALTIAIIYMISDHYFTFSEGYHYQVSDRYDRVFFSLNVAPLLLWLFLAIPLHFRLHQLNKTGGYFAVAPIL